MSCIVTVLYPNDPDATFDMKYYLETHMPLVEKFWKQHGMKSWEVIQHQTNLDGSKPLYFPQVSLVWDKVEQVYAALESRESKTVFGDVSNFGTSLARSA